MKRLLLVFAVLALVGASFAQSITKVELARDNGHGKAGDAVKAFLPADNPIHCVVFIKVPTSTTVFTGTLVAVNAGGVTNYQIATTNISATMGTSSMDFKFSLPRNWPEGTYRVEIRIGSKIQKEISFSVSDKS